MSSPSNMRYTSIDDLTHEEMDLYNNDDSFKQEVDASIRNYNFRNSSKSAQAPQASGQPGNIGNRTGITERAQPAQPNISKLRDMKSVKYPGAKASALMDVIFRSSATKVRELSSAEHSIKFESLCEYLEIPENELERQVFYFSLIGWITLNTASTENGIDSTIGDRYSSRSVLEFFDFDLRPFARACAKDARMFIQIVSENYEHPMHEQVMDLARKFEVPKSPWLIYDGIEGAGLTIAESRLARTIKQQRLDTNVNLNLDATMNRNLLKGNDRRSRADN